MSFMYNEEQTALISIMTKVRGFLSGLSSCLNEFRKIMMPLNVVKTTK